jgi:hypothetical protein
MKEMKAHENREELLMTAISVVITLVGGFGLSILLNGLIRGFFALTAIGFVLLLIIAWHRSLSLELHLRGRLPELKLVDRRQAGRSKGRGSIAD